MALVDEVTARISTQMLVNLTNPQTPTASSVDATRLANAATDAEAEFEIYAQSEYDGTEPRHVVVAVGHTVAILKRYTLQKGADTEYENSVKRLRDLAKVESRARVVPKTNSPLTTTSETSSSRNVIPPATEWTRFEDVVPEPPGGAGG